MTATAHVYTADGFAIAMDGRQRWGDEPSRDGSISQLESDKVQKLFEISGKQMRLAYSVKGDVATADRSFDVTDDLARQIKKLRDRRFHNCRCFVETVATYIEQVINAAAARGRFEGFPATEITFAGYFKGRPCWIEVRFCPHLDRYGMLFEITEHDVKPGLCIVSGSAAIMSMVQAEHPRIADFYTNLNKQTSLEDATTFVTGYVKACCPDWVLELEPDCICIGGHVHVATVKPPESLKSTILGFFGFRRPRKTGFQWVIPPL